MQRCPLCRATLGDDDTCRRCKADLGTVRQVMRESRDLTGAAMHSLAVGNMTDAQRLLRRALDLHATPETRALWELLGELERSI
jgi:hypothetical protein